jgi:2-C-methyl-D-erythritol 2,4-cyclodiphosphate synthase
VVFLTGLGQDSHKFGSNKPLILGGVEFDGEGFIANSDGDVVLHALTNAASGITCKNILGKIADEMCKNGVTDSREYLKAALQDLQDLGFKIEHISISMECLTPKISPKIEKMRVTIANLVGLKNHNIGITATTGEGLSDFGKGFGVFVSVIITVSKNSYNKNMMKI